MDLAGWLTIIGALAAMGYYVYRFTTRSHSPADVPPGSVTVERFYDENPLRRDSAELDLGDGWRDAAQARCTFTVFWLEDTGEVYALRVPDPTAPVHDGAGDFWFGGTAFGPATVEVLGRARTRQELDAWLGERHTKISDPDGLGWIRLQLESP